MAQTFDVCIRGAGIVGRSLALLLARERLHVALLASSATDRLPEQSDVRAYALNAASRHVLESLRVWPDERDATAVRHMEVLGDATAAASSVHFDAAAQGVQALAWIVDVPALEQRLAEAVRYQPQIEVVTAPVAAPLTAICEGRASATRQELGVHFDVTAYSQMAIAARLHSEQGHGQVARQWFGPHGILAFLPLAGPDGKEIAVVWSIDKTQVQHWLDADPEDFAHKLAEISLGALGDLQLQSPRVTWPLQQAIADRWCGSLPGTADQRQPASWVLAGDAAHNVHPLAGQGLNLGLADVQALAHIVGKRMDWRSTGDIKLLRRYERERKAALLPIGLAMDGIQQLFTRTEAPLQTVRNWGMSGFERSGPLKHWIARQAMGLKQ